MVFLKIMIYTMWYLATQTSIKTKAIILTAALLLIGSEIVSMLLLVIWSGYGLSLLAGEVKV